MTNKDEALKMAIEALPELISTAQCEFDSQHKAYEGYPAMYHRYGYLKDIADDGTKVLEACKEALEQPTQEPVAWMHYKNFDLIYHDVWEELLEGKDEWYPLDYYVNSQLHRVVINHVEDLRKCIPALKEYPQMESTVIEVKKAINELEEALYTHPAPSWQGLSNDEIGVLFDSVMDNDKVSTEFFGIEFARAIEQALKEKNI